MHNAVTAEESVAVTAVAALPSVGAAVMAATAAVMSPTDQGFPTDMEIMAIVPGTDTRRTDPIMVVAKSIMAGTEVMAVDIMADAAMGVGITVTKIVLPTPTDRQKRTGPRVCPLFLSVSGFCK
jgi:hypothetical protein